MKKNSLTTAVVAGIAGVAGFAGLANAVHLNPDGLGQVLLYPYYTVNAGQQTLLSVVNTSDVAKAIKVRFLEGYNTREVLDFNVFLSPYDVWTATVFAMRDAGKNSDAGAIFTTDNSCTDPAFSTSGTTITLGDGSSVPAVPFVNYAFVAPIADGGPQALARTREGHFEILTMADLTGSLAAAVTHDGRTNNQGVPANCGAARGISTTDPRLVPPTSGLFGGAAVINVGAGTLYTYNADALEQFAQEVIFTGAENVTPNLATVHDSFIGGPATAHVFTNAGVTESEYGLAPNTRPVDAISAIFAADAIYNEYNTDANIGANSDWVVTFPTKAFYVDVPFRTSFVRQPFEESFHAPGQSCVVIGLTIFDREEGTTEIVGGFSPPPPGDPDNTLCKETNVISFLDVADAPTESGVLGSTLVSNIRPTVGTSGWLKLDLNKVGTGHQMYAATNGNVWSGLPVSGFWASNVVNGNAAVVNGVSTLSNYSGVFRHRTSRDCSNQGYACS